MNELIDIANFVGKAFMQLWPYLLVTIPVAVAVNLSGGARYVQRAFDASPVNAIFLATMVGAFSPFCSCGVIPVIAAMLISGVPLAPVMSFWVASPSMDPEIFFLSVGAIGWDLALWRLLGTFFLSLSAGFITHYGVQNQWFGGQILRRGNGAAETGPRVFVPRAWQRFIKNVKDLTPSRRMASPAGSYALCCAGSTPDLSGHRSTIQGPLVQTAADVALDGLAPEACGCGGNTAFGHRLFKESLSATLMVLKFMLLAFFLEALIVLYVPQEWIVGLVGRKSAWSVTVAALLGVPVYTSNLSALPLISGLLAQGMTPAAALSFLIAGPTTTLPAMAAVWSLVSRRVFLWYVSCALFGAMALGYLKLVIG